MQRRYLAIPCGMILGLAGFVACTTFDTNPVESEAGVEASDRPDAVAPPLDGATPRCTLTMPFGKPVLVPTLNKPAHHSLSARQAGDFLYFSSDRHAAGLDFNQSDIYRARFQGDDFTDIQRLAGVSTADVEDVGPTETADGLTLFLAVGKIDSRKIKRSARADRAQPYAAPSPVGPAGIIVPGAAQESDPYLVGNRLYFTSRGDGGADSSVYQVGISADGPDGPAFLAAGPFAGVLRYPVVNKAETELYFVEYVFDAPTLYLARRGSVEQPFANPGSQPTLDIPGSTNVNVTGLSADDCDLYLAARLGQTEPFNIYRARRGSP